VRSRSSVQRELLGDSSRPLWAGVAFVRCVKNTYEDRSFLTDEHGGAARWVEFRFVTTVATVWGGHATVDMDRKRPITPARLVGVSGMTENRGMIEKSEDVEALARTVQDNGRRLLPFRNFPDCTRRIGKAKGGVIAALRRYENNKGHSPAQILEATGFDAGSGGWIVGKRWKRTSIWVMVPGLPWRRHGGERAGMQFQADSLNREVVRR